MNIWLNGALVPAGAARIDPADRGFLLGDGVFETLRVAAGVPLHLARHLARLRAGASVLGVALAWHDDALADAAAAVLAGLPEASLRITLTRGPGPRGLAPPGDLQPTLLMSAATLAPPAAPARAIVARATRRNEHSPLSRIKSLNYLDQILARREAAAAGADDALLLNTAGRLACATAGNVFLLLEGAWITPPVEDGALPGIVRALLLEAGFARPSSVTAAMIARAESALITNSLGIRCIASLDGTALSAPGDRCMADLRASAGPEPGLMEPKN